MTPLLSGIFLNFDGPAYFADPCPVPSLTQSIAKTIIEKSPKHAWIEHPRLNPAFAGDKGEPYSKAKAIGNAAHAMLIGRGKSIQVIKADDFRGKAAQEERRGAEAVGHVAILAKHMDDATAITESARYQLKQIEGCEKVFIAGSGEVVICAEQDGTWFRSMVDWLESPRALWDLKTVGQVVAPYAIGKKMAQDGWDIQAAMQEHILDLLDPDGAGRRTFRFVAIENEPPYALTVAELSESVMTMGRKKLAYAIEQWRACIAADHWPAYPAEIVLPSYPGYRETEWLNREIEYADHTERKLQAKSQPLTSLAGG